VFAWLGALGCDPPYYSSAAFFANTTREPVNVRLSRLDAALSCLVVSGRSAVVLSQSAFEHEAMYRVQPGEALPLGPVDENDDFDSEAIGTPCGAVMLQILGQRDLGVFWGSTTASTERLASVQDKNFRDHAVRLEGTKGLHRLAVGDALEGSEPRNHSTSDDPPRLFGWSGQGLGVTSVIVRRDVLPDGCLAVSTGGATLYLCVPDWAFPFQVGDTMAVTATTPSVPVSADPNTWVSNARKLVVKDSAASPTRELEIWLDAHSGVIPVRTKRLIGPGHFTSCGAYVEPVGVTLTPPGVPARGELEPGALDDYVDGNVRVRVMLGRTERVVVAPSGCEPGRSTLNDHFDLLTLRTPEGT
jgi:hypothetical protein